MRFNWNFMNECVNYERIYMYMYLYVYLYINKLLFIPLDGQKQKRKLQKLLLTNIHTNVLSTFSREHKYVFLSDTTTRYYVFNFLMPFITRQAVTYKRKPYGS